MSAQTIRRTGKSARKMAAQQGKARQIRKARATTGSALDTAMRWLPISEAQWHRIFLAMILGGAVVLAWMAASFAGVPAMAGQQLEVISHQAGFEVTKIKVNGVNHLNELKIYEQALADNHRAMPFVDVEALRARVMELSWVEDARVSRQLPDTLVIDIIERKPVAVLRKPGKLVLIDGTGHELEPVSAARAKGKLVVSGLGASRKVEDLAMLLDAAPALKPQVREAEWIGNRRWNLTFRTGQVLALPEGAKPSAGALMTFARLDGVNRLLGGRVAAFDMRAPDRIYMRVPHRTDPVEQSGSAESSKTTDTADAAPAKTKATQEKD